uniref:Metallo-beta-lactamase domain-containing protein n=1 Tax=Zooxanthella nutricula TaxID=1333877 RepID=A0A7S2VN95_9DINO
MEQFPLRIGAAVVHKIEETTISIPPAKFFKSEAKVEEERATGRPGASGAPEESSGYYETAAAEEVCSKVRALEWMPPTGIDGDGNLQLAVQMFVIETPGGTRIAVDTCIGDDKSLGPNHEKFHMKQGPFLQNLHAAGCDPESIHFVLCTHLHFDHVGFNTVLRDGVWVPTFPNAKYLVAEKEWMSCLEEVKAKGDDGFAPFATILRESLQPIVDAGLQHLVSSDHVIVDEDSCKVRLVPTEGHTPGHVGVVIESNGTSAVITGDCIHHMAQLAYPQMGTWYDANSADAADTREALFDRVASEGAILIGTHFPVPSACFVERDAKGSGRRYRPRPCSCCAASSAAVAGA